MSAGSLAAIDLGASSGRVIVGRVGADTLAIEEVHRFPNDPVALPDGLHWDAVGLYRPIIEGLRRAASAAPDLAGVAVDPGASTTGCSTPPAPWSACRSTTATRGPTAWRRG